MLEVRAPPAPSLTAAAPVAPRATVRMGVDRLASAEAIFRRLALRVGQQGGELVRRVRGVVAFEVSEDRSLSPFVWDSQRSVRRGARRR